MNDDFINKHSSKIGFLFVSFIVIASGYVTQVLPCQTQNYLQHSVMGKHLIGWLICFLFIMLEGGWSFNMTTQNKADVDWSNGNVLDTLAFGLGLYLIFLFTAKMELMTNSILMVLLFIVYATNTQRLYWHNRELITDDENKRLIDITRYTLIASIIVFFFGITRYMIRQKKQYGKHFSILTFISGSEKCHSLK